MSAGDLGKGLGIQATFREAVLAAYGAQCAISHLPEPRLLDAAHIVMDADEQFGQPIVSNGLPLSKLHHAAFDAHLIGIESDYRIQVSDRLLDIHDGPFFELGLKGIAGILIDRPRRFEDRSRSRPAGPAFRAIQESDNRVDACVDAREGLPAGAADAFS